MRRRTQDWLLVALAVVTAVAVVLALTSVQPAEPRTDPLPAPPEDRATTTEPAPAPSTSTPPASDTSQRTTSSPEESEPEAPSLAGIVAGTDDEPVSVLVLGDDTSNTRSEWVHAWGELEAQDRPTTVAHWDETGDVSYVEPDVLSEDGAGAPLTIWSASRTGANVSVTTDRLSELLPETGDPDLVLINLGTNDGAQTVVDDLDQLLAGIRTQLGEVPVAVVDQGEGGASNEVAVARASWAEANDIEVLDASDASSAGEWAEVVYSLLNG